MSTYQCQPTSTKHSSSLTIPNRAPLKIPPSLDRTNVRSKSQITTPPSRRPLTPKQTHWVQENVGIFMYYAHAVDNTMLTSIGYIASAHSTSSFADIRQRILHFLDYVAFHPNASIRYAASQMQLWAHIDASYLCKSKARSRAGGYHFLWDKPSFPIRKSDTPPPLNAPVLVILKKLTAQEAERGAGLVNGKDFVPSIRALEEMDYQQSPVPLQFDNNLATSWMTNANKNSQKVWTCIIIGCLTVHVRNNFIFFGVGAKIPQISI